jgi:iron transport multicopper oxidase
VLAGGMFPGPVVKGYKGDRFQINVVNLLNDDTMLKTTSVVSGLVQFAILLRLLHIHIDFYTDSTGMEYFNEIRAGQMDYRLSPNAPSHRGTHFYMTFVYQIRRGHSGTIRMTVSLYPSYSIDNLSSFKPATQYCDGLRGAFIVYDPYDPHRLLYDVDDGENE